MIDRKMRKNEKEGVMQRENERIIYHLMHFDENDMTVYKSGALWTKESVKKRRNTSKCRK